MIDVFKVGVHIGMTSNAPQVLATMLHQLTGVNVAANHLHGQLSKIRTAAIGVGTVFIGWQVGKGLLSAVKHAEKLNHELSKLQIGARLSDEQTAAAGRLAFATSRDVRGTEVHENVKVQRELFGVFGSMKTAQELAPLVIQANRAISRFADVDTDLAQTGIKALELRGAIAKDHHIDPKLFQDELSFMARAIVASEGMIKPRDILQFVQQAGPAARGMTPEAMWGLMPAVMVGMGSQKAGTALSSFFTQMIGHVVAGKRVAIAMEEAGFLQPGKWKVERGGKVRMDPDAVVDQAGLAANPIQWLHERLQAMRQMKGPDGKPIDEVSVLQRIFQFSSRATSARFISDVDANYAVMLNELRRFRTMPGPAKLVAEQDKGDLTVNIRNLTAAWSNFMTALGGPGVPVAIQILSKTTDGLNELQAILVAHPELAKDLIYLAGGISALMALGGSIVVFNVAVGPFVTGIRLLVGLGAGMAAAGAGASALAGGVTTLAGGLAALAGPVGAILAILKLGSDYDTPENRKRLDDLSKLRTPKSPTRMAPQDGFDEMGRPLPEGGPVRKQSFAVPPPAERPVIQTIVYTQLDGRTIAKTVSQEQARAMSMPPAGATRFDGRMTQLSPAAALRA